MLRKTIATTLIALVGAGTVFTAIPLGTARRDTAAVQRIVGEQTGPKRALRFKAPRPVNLRKAEVERVQPVAIG